MLSLRHVNISPYSIIYVSRTGQAINYSEKYGLRPTASRHPRDHRKKGNPRVKYIDLVIAYYKTGIIQHVHISLHRATAMVYPEICGCPDIIKTTVDHIDGNASNNIAVNLRWLSHHENSAQGGRKRQMLRRSQKSEQQ